MDNPEGWSVEFRDGPADGPVRAAASGNQAEVVAWAIVVNAMKNGVGDKGELGAGGLFAGGYETEVISIDYDKKVVVVALRE